MTAADADFSTAMLLAAGLGTRMRPLTDTLPKPLIRVAGKALVDHVLDRLAGAGVKHAVVNVHYLADLMEAHLASRVHPQITISDERHCLLDSGGGVARALPLLGERPFIVCNCDSFWIEGRQAALPALFSAWQPDRMDILMLLAATDASSGYDGAGDYHCDHNGRLNRRAAGESAPFVYAGVLLAKPELFAGYPDVFSLNRIFDRAEAEGRLYGQRLDGIWLHVGTPQAIDAAQARIAATSV